MSADGGLDLLPLQLQFRDARARLQLVGGNDLIVDDGDDAVDRSRSGAWRCRRRSSGRRPGRLHRLSLPKLALAATSDATNSANLLSLVEVSGSDHCCIQKGSSRAVVRGHQRAYPRVLAHLLAHLLVVIETSPAVAAVG